MPLRAKPIRPISQVNETARMISTYCERTGIWPQRMAPRVSAPRSISTSSTTTSIIAASTEST